MTFNPNIPTATQRISQSQAPIQTNFLTSDQIFNIDHVTFDDVMTALRGYHRKVTFSAVLGFDPNFVAPISCLYTKGTPPQLYFQNGNLASNVAQITGLTVSTSANPGSAGGTIYKIVTPWGITLFSGQTTSGTGTRQITLPNSLGTVYTAVASANTGSSSIVAPILIQSGSILQVFTTNSASVNWFCYGST